MSVTRRTAVRRPDRSSPSPHNEATRGRVVMAGRGDPLLPHLARALAERYDLVADVDAELSRAERLLVAGTTFRPSRRSWVEHFYKSNLAVSLRSHRANDAIDRADQHDVVVQTHALFELTDARTVLYVDCTHRQSMEQWPDWNPLRGQGLQRWLWREGQQYRRAEHLFAFSGPTCDSLVEDYGIPQDRVSVVGAGVNFPVLPNRPSSRPIDSAPTILFVGNDFVRKGGPRLLKAFRLVREAVPNARLQIVGTPHPIAAEPGVEVLGRVADRDEMTTLYAGATVFALPAFFDPFPLVVLEAMAHELPVVATPTCGVPEMVVDGSTGHLLPSDTRDWKLVPALAETLIRVLQDRHSAAAMGAAGRRRVEERFLWSHVVDRMAPALDALAG